MSSRFGYRGQPKFATLCIVDIQIHILVMIGERTVVHGLVKENGD